MSAQNLLEMTSIMRRKNYAMNTIETYNSILKSYLNFCRRQHTEVEHSLELYIRKLVNEKKALSTQNQAINAIKFYLENILSVASKYYNIPRPMKEKSLPVVFNEDEVRRLLQVTHNQKHRMILKVIYGCGLRVGELLRLKLADIDGQRKLIHIKKSKGRKDRIVPLSESLLVELRQYYKEYKPFLYLFEGQGSLEDKPLPYCATSIRAFYKRSIKKANIKKKAILHTLRHSYATHLYEHNVHLRNIQTLLGHGSSKTTEIYTHVSSRELLEVPCPLDFLDK